VALDQNDPNGESRLDPRAVPIAVVSVAVIVLGILLTYVNTTIGAVVVLLGLGGVVWVGAIATRQTPPE
jgi:hypothetical protein